MKIYKYRDGKMHTLEVKETKKSYIVTGNTKLVFGCAKMFPKNHTCITPDEAIQEAKNAILTRLGMHKDAYEKAQQDMDILSFFVFKPKVEI